MEWGSVYLRNKYTGDVYYACVSLPFDECSIVDNANGPLDEGQHLLVPTEEYPFVIDVLTAWRVMYMLWDGELELLENDPS